MLLNNKWVNNEMKEEIKNTLRQIKIKITQRLWNATKAVLIGKNSNTRLPQKQNKTKTKTKKINKLSLHLKEPEKEKQMKVSRGKAIIKIREKNK